MTRGHADARRSKRELDATAAARARTRELAAQGADRELSRADVEKAVRKGVSTMDAVRRMATGRRLHRRRRGAARRRARADLGGAAGDDTTGGRAERLRDDRYARLFVAGSSTTRAMFLAYTRLASDKVASRQARRAVSSELTRSALMAAGEERNDPTLPAAGVMRVKPGVRSRRSRRRAFAMLAAIDAPRAYCGVELTITSACDGAHSGPTIRTIAAKPTTSARTATATR
jgi:hypothetical protein